MVWHNPIDVDCFPPQIIPCLLQEVIEDDRPLLTETYHNPKNVKVYGVLKFPNDGIAFHAQPSNGGKPWFDFGWLSVSDDQPGAEMDPFNRNAKRMLVKFWGFPEVNNVVYAIVTYYRRTRSSHPLLKSYKLLPVYRRGVKVLPLYAIKPNCILGSAVVFPDPDNEDQVLFMPSDAEICKGSNKHLPDIDKILARQIDNEEEGEEEEGKQEMKQEEGDDNDDDDDDDGGEEIQVSML